MYDNCTLYYMQGWICPMCKSVCSPNSITCMFCGNRSTVATNAIEQKKDDGIIRKIMVGDTPETMKQIRSDGKW